MDAKKILQSNMLDILFEHRNKAYGAYALRKSYNNRIKKSLLVTIGIVAAFVGLSFLPKSETRAAPKRIFVDVVRIKDYKKPKPPKKVPPPRAAAAPKLEMQKLTIPKIVVDKEVKPEELPPKQTAHINIGAVTQHGLKIDGGLAAPPEVRGIGGHGKGLGGSGDDDGIGDNHEFFSVQVKARYPGGEEAWQKYLRRHLQSNIPTDNGAPAGNIRIVVSFLVSKDGTVSEVEAIAAPSPDYGAAAEAVRVISKSGKWKPAIQNGREVTYRQTQAIVFSVVQ